MILMQIGFNAGPAKINYPYISMEYQKYFGNQVISTSRKTYILQIMTLWCVRLFWKKCKSTITCDGADAVLTHWGRVTHICVSNLTTIGSVNGLSPGRHQAITWTNAGILLIGPLGTNFSEILIKIPTFSFKKMRLKVSSAKWRPFCLGLNVLTHCVLVIPYGDIHLDQHWLRL